jgi:hypothetical protein
VRLERDGAPVLLSPLQLDGDVVLQPSLPVVPEPRRRVISMRAHSLVAIALAAAAATLAVGCKQPEQIALRYRLDGIAPADVIRVETLVDVAPGDERAFFADQPYRSVAQGVGYEVRDFDGSGRRRLLITHDATLGYGFTSQFQFTLLPPAGPEVAPRLSITARAVGARDEIGNTRALEAGFARGAAVDVVIGDQRCGGATCAPNEACCDGACVRALGDPRHCGGCGNACGANEQCTGGVCQCGSASACAAGQTCCPGLGCVDLASDAFHCGACDKECSPGEMCVAGQCTCNGGGACSAPPTGVALCCAGMGCSSTGSCTCGGTDCAAPRVCCGGTECRDVRSDNDNCGACGRRCAAGLTCRNGACTCAGAICSTGDTCCSTGCANLQNDVRNCGACGKSCQPGEICANGRCACVATTPSPGGPLPPQPPSCSSGQTCCGGTCSTLVDDVRNCGACGIACRIGEQCDKGTCSCEGGAPCVGNQRCCPGGFAGPGGCFDTSHDPQNCGACGNRCATGQICSSGVCVSGGCSCSNNNQCTSNGGCSCNGGPACTGSSNCCGMAGCRDLLTDEQNCGACGKACGVGQLCCGGACVDQGELNCGGCGVRCGVGQSCCLPCQPGGAASCGLACVACAPGGGGI